MRHLSHLLLAAAAIGGTSAAAAGGHDHAGQTFEVTITNVTRGQSFTPQLLVTHNRRVSLFTLGEPASPSLEMLAEGGATGPLTNDLLGLDGVKQTHTIAGLLGPGQTVSATIRGGGRYDRLSLAAMLVPTNDTFVALNGVRLPEQGVARYWAVAHDAGTEANDQHCDHIPGGGGCAGEGHSPGPNVGDEGYVYVGNGFHTLAPDDPDVLGPLEYDWSNPVALIEIRALHRQDRQR